MFTPEEQAQLEEINDKVDHLISEVKRAWDLLEELLPKRNGVMQRMMKGKKP